jgi:hypothetical protein
MKWFFLVTSSGVIIQKMENVKMWTGNTHLKTRIEKNDEHFKRWAYEEKSMP